MSDQATPNPAKQITPTDCANDPIGTLKTMFVDMVQAGRIKVGQDPVERPVFLKPHGVARGTFRVVADLPKELRVGVFAGESYPTWVRFSSDTVPSQPDLGTTLGIGMKLFGVPGEKLLAPDNNATTHDFLMQNHPVFFVDTAKDMCEFTYAGVVLKDYDTYLAAHPATKRILDEMSKKVSSVLVATYWSVLPYRFGKERYAKYKLVPAATAVDPLPGISTDDPQYLHVDLHQRLLAEDATFTFWVQFYKDDKTTPLDHATTNWEEAVSPPIQVATLTIPKQDINARGQADYGENLAYNPWHALEVHEPAGSISAARKVVYQASAQQRRDANAIPTGEPTQPRPLEMLPAGRDTRIVRAAIYPAIGVARVGNSQTEFFFGPEVIHPTSQTPGFYKDSSGALKRQAVRFRIYGYNAAGDVVAELTANNADISWNAHVANLKAAWYQFQIALDIPEAAMTSPAVDPSLRRNASVKGADREKLAINPGSIDIGGTNKSGSQYWFDQGKFYDKKVYLGELRTDELGRLIFLGGRGVSASSDSKPATTFANNDGWHDDVADGPVKAIVKINGEAIPCESAWVVVGPPNYAPDLVSVRTMYDLLRSNFIDNGLLQEPPTVSFRRDILPTLQRLSGLQWVNAGFATAFGWLAHQNFDDPAYLRQLSRKPASADTDEFNEVRRQILNSFRNYDRDGMSPVPWPWIYGDAMDNTPVSPRQHSTLSPLQMRLLNRWVAGDFIDDLDDLAPVPTNLAQVPLAQQPDMLNEASLTFCLADAFHPGCEITWPIRHISMFTTPFRIKHRPADQPERDYGRQLTPAIALGSNGPLYAQGPGGLTRWMAVPWQTDTASCQSGYDPAYDPLIPTFWAARVPNQVLTQEAYETASDSNLPPEDRLRAFRQRLSWMRVMAPSYPVYINQMVGHFGALGVVEARVTPKGDVVLPPVVLVESKPGPIPALMQSLAPHAAAVAGEDGLATSEKARRFHR